MESEPKGTRRTLAAGMGMSAAVCLCLIHFAWLLSYFEPVISGPDANGYFAQARRIAEDGRVSFERESGLQYINMHWLGTAGAGFVSRYPPGLPLILAAGYKMGGPVAAMLVNPALTSAALLGVYFLARAWAGPGWALVAAVAMAVNPTANGRAFAGDAHPAVSFFLVWGLWLLVRWASAPTAGRAFVVGLWLGYIPTLRYSEAIYGLGFAWFLWATWRSGGASGRSLMAALAGGVIPAAALAAHEAWAWGAVGHTGYSASAPIFTWRYFVEKAIPYLQSTQSGGAGLFAAFGVGGIAFLAARRETRREGLLLALLVVPPVALYAAYFFYDATMRFLLPTFYLYAVAAVWLLKSLAETNPAAARAAAGVCLLLTCLSGATQSAASLTAEHQANATLAKAAREVASLVEPGAVLIVPQNLAQHLDFLGRWRLADPQFFSDRVGGPMGGPPMGGPPGGGPPGGAVGGDQDLMQELTQQEERQRVRARYLGAEGDPLPQLWSDLAAWSGGRRIYWLGDPGQMADWAGDNARVAAVARIDAPRGMGPGGGGPGGRMGGPAGRLGGPMGGFGPGGRRGGPGFAGPGGFGARGMGPGPFGGAVVQKLTLARLDLAARSPGGN